MPLGFCNYSEKMPGTPLDSTAGLRFFMKSSALRRQARVTVRRRTWFFLHQSNLGGRRSRVQGNAPNEDRAIEVPTRDGFDFARMSHRSFHFLASLSNMVFSSMTCSSGDIDADWLTSQILCLQHTTHPSSHNRNFWSAVQRGEGSVVIEPEECAVIRQCRY